MPELRNRLAELMAEYGMRRGTKLTQMELSEKTGVSQRTISLYTRNEISRYDSLTVVALLDFFGVGPERFFIVIEDAPENDDVVGEWVAVATA